MKALFSLRDANLLTDVGQWLPFKLDFLVKLADRQEPTLLRLRSCSADAITYSSLLYGPPVTVYAVCLQPASADTETNNQGQPQQGQPSQETLLLLESLRNEMAERARPVDSVN